MASKTNGDVIYNTTKVVRLDFAAIQHVFHTGGFTKSSRKQIPRPSVKSYPAPPRGST